jgi:hypothetical protein
MEKSGFARFFSMSSQGPVELSRISATVWQSSIIICVCSRREFRTRFLAGFLTIDLNTAGELCTADSRKAFDLTANYKVERSA